MACLRKQAQKDAPLVDAWLKARGVDKPAALLVKIGEDHRETWESVLSGEVDPQSSICVFEEVLDAKHCLERHLGGGQRIPLSDFYTPAKTGMALKALCLENV